MSYEIASRDHSATPYLEDEARRHPVLRKIVGGAVIVAAIATPAWLSESNKYRDGIEPWRGFFNEQGKIQYPMAIDTPCVWSGECSGPVLSKGVETAKSVWNALPWANSNTPETDPASATVLSPSEAQQAVASWKTRADGVVCPGEGDDRYQHDPNDPNSVICVYATDAEVTADGHISVPVATSEAYDQPYTADMMLQAATPENCAGMNKALTSLVTDQLQLAEGTTVPVDIESPCGTPLPEPAPAGSGQ